jgi:hypothetical protein
VNHRHHCDGVLPHAGRVLEPLLSRSVADPGCLSRIPIFTYPGFRIPKTATKERGEKKNSCHNFFWEPQISQNEKFFTFEMLKKKI